MTIMNSMQISQMMAMQQQAMGQQMAYSQAVSAQMNARGGMMYGGTNSQNNMGYAAASTFMAGMQAAPKIAEYGMLAGGIGAAAMGAMPLSAGGGAMGAVAGGLLGGPGGALMGAAYGALPSALGMGIPALAYGGMYAASQMGQGFAEYGQTRSALGNYNFQNPLASSGRGFSTGQAGQITSALRDISLTSGAGMQELTGMVAQMPSMGLMQGVRDAQEFERKFKEIVQGVKQMTTVLGTSMSEALPFFADLRRSGFYSTQDIVGNAVQRQVLGTMGYSGQQFTQLQRTGAAIAQHHGSRRSTGAGLATRLAGSLGTAVQEGIISEESIMEATGGMTGADAYNQLAGRFTEQAFNFTHTAVGRAMMLGMGEIKDGRYTGKVDASQMARLRAGDIDIFNARSEGSRRLGGGRGSRVSFVANEELIRGNMMEQAGPEMIESIVRDVAKGRGIAGAEEDIVTLLMKRFTNLQRAEAEVMVEMSKNAATIRQQQRQKIIQEVDREITQAQNQRSSIRGRMGELGRMWGGAVEYPLREAGQAMGRGIEADVQRMTDRISGQYQVNISDADRQNFMFGGLDGGGSADMSSVLARSGGTVGGLGGTQEFRHQLGGGGAAISSLGSSQFGSAVALEQRRARGTLTSADIGLTPMQTGRLGGQLEDVTLESRAFDRRGRTGRMTSGFLARKFGDEMGIEGWDEMSKGQQRDIMRRAASDAGVTLEGEKYAVGAGSMAAGRSRDELIEELAQGATGQTLGSAAGTTALQWGIAAAQGGLALPYGAGRSISNITDVVKGRGDFSSVGAGLRTVAGMTVIGGAWQGQSDMAKRVRVMGGKRSQAVRDVMAGDSASKVASFLGGGGGKDDKVKKLLEYKKLSRKAGKTGKGGLSEAEEVQWKALQAEMGDLSEGEITSLLKATRNMGEEELRGLGQAIVDAGNVQKAEEFAAAAGRIGSGLMDQIGDAGAKRAGVSDEAYREISDYASRLAGMDAEKLRTEGMPSTAALARSMKGMSSEERASTMAYLGTLGATGEQMAASVNVRLNKGKRSISNLSGKDQASLVTEIGQRTGVDLEGHMRDVESGSVKESELYRKLQRSTSDKHLDPEEGERLSQLIADALDKNIVSAGASSGTKTGTVSGDVAQLATSIEKAMTVNTAFVKAVGEELPKLKKKSPDLFGEPGDTK